MGVSTGSLREGLRSLLSGKEGFPLPSEAAGIPDYQSSFSRAVVFSEKCGFEVNAPLFHGSDVLGSDGNFLAPVMQAAGVRDATKSAGQCLKWCHWLAPSFEKQLGCRVWPTLGQIWKGDRSIFNPTWDDLKRWSKAGIQIEDLRGREGINFHAWLTLESGEILEPTLLSSLARVLGGTYTRYAGAVVWGRDPGVLNGHRYFPMAVGREFAEAIDRNSVISLLATNADELHQLQQVLVYEPTR